MPERDLKKRTAEFAHRCIKLCIALPKDDLGNHVRRQLIKSSTSVAANYRAACLAQSRADFAAKLSVAIEEVDETCFWMEFVVEEELLSEQQATSLLDEGRELTAILVTSRRTVSDRTPEFATGS
jgi:four helix bundle protein